MAYYRKKPVVIMALQWTEDNFVQIRNFLGIAYVYWDEESNTIAINTLEGETSASVGDWIIRGVAGDFYPCRPAIFEITYEQV